MYNAGKPAQNKIIMTTNNFKILDPGQSYTRLKKNLGVAYLGGVSTSHKLDLSEKAGVLTFGLYLAPWKMSGFQVCAGGAHCHEFCLNGSGQNRADEMAHGHEFSHINQSRVKKTRLFFQNRPVFMRLLIHEINRAYMRAMALGLPFAVRLNCTSDLSPEMFVDPVTGKNILQLFPHVQFYDYTKVPGRLRLIGKYANYDLTFSYDGYNWDSCKKFIDAGGRAAVVFLSENTPKTFAGYNVVCGDSYDMRYLDPAGVVKLTYHRVANDYKTKNGEKVFVVPETPFVVKDDDPRAVW